MDQNDPARNQDHDMHRGAKKTEPRDATDAGRNTQPESGPDLGRQGSESDFATDRQPLAGGKSGS